MTIVILIIMITMFIMSSILPIRLILLVLPNTVILLRSVWSSY